jgi:hypothetical protein
MLRPFEKSDAFGQVYDYSGNTAKLKRVNACYWPFGAIQIGHCHSRSTSGIGDTRHPAHYPEERAWEGAVGAL